MTTTGSIDQAALTWRWCRFAELSFYELESIYRARQEVFAIEQACAYLDADGYDIVSWHLAAWAVGQTVPMAYARVVAPGYKYAEPSIGRLITAAPARGTGLGRELVRRAMAQCRVAFPGRAIRINAQARLEDFYVAFGFSTVGAPYIDDGIPHIEMLAP